jgi:dCMP deaminase
LHTSGNECAKVIIQAGLSEVIYLRDAADELDGSCSLLRASRLMFLQAGVKMRRHEPERMCIDLEFGQFLETSDADNTDEKNSCSTSTSATTSIPTTTTTTTLQQQQHRELMLLEARGYDPCKTPSGKRTGYLSWDDYYMAVAFLTAQRSKDPNTQVGACIVMNQRIVGLGYNGFPAGCSDDHLPWARTDPNNNNNPLHTKYPYVCHAEMNAILNKCTTDIHGATLYVALFPCNECTKVIIQAGIREVVYMSDKYHDTDTCRASRIMLQMAGVKTRNYVPSRLSLAIHLSAPKPSK